MIRGITKLTGKPWEDVYTELSIYGYSFGDWGNSNAVFDAYLRDQGYKRSVIPNTCPNCYTVDQFCKDNPHGRFLVCTGRHVVGIENGDYFDSWDSGGVSFAAQPQQASLNSGSAFAKKIEGLPTHKILALFDEVMDTLQAINPPLYAAIMRKL